MGSSEVHYRIVLHKQDIAVDAFTRLVRDLGVLLPEPLDIRVDVRSYSSKLYQKAELAVAVSSDRTPIGVAAFYANDVVAKRSYLSFFGVRPEQSGAGIATALLQTMFEVLEDRAFLEVACHVHRTNASAIRLYSRFGFVVTSEDDQRFAMAAPVGGSRLGRARHQ